MRATAVRRTALAASAAALALLVTACGGGSSDADAKGGKDDKGTAGGGSSAPKTPAKALTAAELEKATLAQGDVEGRKVTEAGPDDEVPADGVTVDKKECLPVAHAMYGVAQKGSVATTKRKVIDEPKKTDGKKSLEDLKDGGAEDAFKDAFNLTSTFVALNSYEGTAGPDAFAALKKAAADCAGGFTATVSRHDDEVRLGHRGEGHRRRRVRGLDGHLRRRRRPGPVQAGGAAQGGLRGDVLRLQPGGGGRRCDVRGAGGGRGGAGQEARLTYGRDAPALSCPALLAQGRGTSRTTVTVSTDRET